MSLVIRRLYTLLIVVCVLLPGCRRETAVPPTQTATTATTATTPVETGPIVGGRLVRRLETDVTTLNVLLQSSEDDRQVLQYLFDPLIDFDANLEPIAGTVVRWEITDGGRSYVLHIDPRATFSDGAAITANDVLFTLHRIIDEPSMQFSAMFDGLDRERTRVIDDKTIRVVFEQPRVTQLYAFNIGVLPRHVYGKGPLAKNRAVVGNGPYVLKQRQTGRSILLERNPHYWREKPPIDSILFRIISDDTVAWNALRRGDVHVGYVRNETWFRFKDDPEIAAAIEFHDTYLLSYNCIPWNLKDPLFQEPAVRRALAMAFDRQGIIEKLYHGQARPVTGPFTPDSWAYNQTVHPIEYNPTAAAALLTSAGWQDTDSDGILDRDGKPFAFTLLIPAGNRTSIDQSQIFQDALRRIGVDVTISTLDGAAFFDRILKGNYQAAMLAWTNDPDPDPYSLFHSTQAPPAGLNVTYYASAEADPLLERGRTEFDRERRTAIYHHLHEVVAADQPYLFTVQVGMKWAVSRKVQNVRTAKGLGLFLWNPGPFGWWLRPAA